MVGKAELLARAAMALQGLLLACAVAAPAMVYVSGQRQQQGRQRRAGGGAAGRRTYGFGLGTALSAPLTCAVAGALAQASALLLGDGLAPAAMLACACAAGYLAASTAARLERAAARRRGLADLLEVPWDTVMGWWLLEALFFYATGERNLL